MKRVIREDGPLSIPTPFVPFRTPIGATYGPGCGFELQYSMMHFVLIKKALNNYLFNSTYIFKIYM